MGALKFSKTYFLATIILLIVETGIAIFVHDTFIRPFVGDTLALILVYCGLKTIIRGKKLKIAALSLGIALSIEALQATPFIDWVGLSHNKVARIILGSTFDGLDVLAYSVGALLIIIFDSVKTHRWTVNTF